MFRGVASVAPDVLHFVAGVFERARHRLVGHPPVAGEAAVVVRAILQKDPDGLGLELADQGGIALAAVQAVAADGAEHAGERVGPLPRCGKRASRAGARAGDGTVLGFPRKTDGTPVRWLAG